MNDQISIEVKCHSGYKSDEYPIWFYWEGIRFEIVEIIDRWYQGKNNPEFPVSNYYKVKTSCLKIFLLKYEIEEDKWYLLVHGESLNF